MESLRHREAQSQRMPTTSQLRTDGVVENLQFVEVREILEDPLWKGGQIGGAQMPKNGGGGGQK